LLFPYRWKLSKRDSKSKRKAAERGSLHRGYTLQENIFRRTQEANMHIQTVDKGGKNNI